MKNELDLIQELSELTEAKVESFGELSVASERRFRELKAFYDDLMSRRAGQKVPTNERYTADELRSRLPFRARLRMPADMSLFFCHHDAYAPARSVNVSRGGLYLGSEVTLSPGTRLTLYMPNLGRGYESLFETEVDVVWSPQATVGLGRGMGVRFRKLGRAMEQELDAYIVNSLREKVSRTNKLDFRPSFLRASSTLGATSTMNDG